MTTFSSLLRFQLPDRNSSVLGTVTLPDGLTTSSSTPLDPTLGLSGQPYQGPKPGGPRMPSIEIAFQLTDEDGQTLTLGWKVSTKIFAGDELVHLQELSDADNFTLTVTDLAATPQLAPDASELRIEYKIEFD